MRYMPIALILLWILPFFLLAGEEEKKPGPPKRGEAWAVHVEKGPKIDGTLKDPLWEKCKPWPMGACTAENPQKYKTEARVLFDDKNVYVGVFCAEPNTGELAKAATERDGDVWKDDSVEVFLRPDPEEAYYQFAVNPIGTIMDSRCASSKNRDAKWNGTAEVKAAVEEGKAWTATIRVPMNEIDAYVGKNQLWTMNIFRTRPKRGGDTALEYAWALMASNDYHSTGDFGMLYGVNVPKVEGGVTRERKEPPPKPKTTDKGTVVGGVTIYRKVNFDKDEGGFSVSGKGKATLSDDAVSGKAFHVTCEGRWTGPQIGFEIKGSKDLRIAMMAKGLNYGRASLNVYDRRAKDNTTTYASRFIDNGKWTPIIYHLDRFRYNSKTTGYVGRATDYTGMRLYGPDPTKVGKEVAVTIDNYVLYRGIDKQPPAKVSGLKANGTDKGVSLSWDVAEDNVFTMLYVISRAKADGAFTKVAESFKTTYVDASAGKEKCRYRVMACDYEQNLGPWSDVVEVEGKSEPQTGELSREEKDRLNYAENVFKVHQKGIGKVRKNHIFLYGDSLTGATTYPQMSQAAAGIYTIGNRGAPGMRTGWGKANVQTAALKPGNPEFMFVLFGTNNVRGRVAKKETLDQWMSEMEAIVKAGEEHGTVVMIGTIPPRGFKDPESKGEAVYNKRIVELATKLKIPVGYIFEDLQAAGDRKKYIAGDGVHWKGPGMEIGGRAWGKALRQIEFVVRDRPGD